jgi:hypothetical protein
VKLTVTIESNNYAFTSEDEPGNLHVAEALDEQVVEFVREGVTVGIIVDRVSGQTIGSWEYQPGETE